jgi:DNA-binding beta-propeller fold protein YncE
MGGWGSFGSGDGQFYGPEGIAHDAAGNIFVCDTGNNRVQKFTAGGAHLSTFGSLGTGLGNLFTPSDVALDPNGEIFVCEWNNARIHRWSYTNPTPTRSASWGSVKKAYR